MLPFKRRVVATVALMHLAFGLLVLAQETPADAPRGCVYLGLQREEDDERAVGLLVREIFRQAFLMAARDGHGLATRDGVLGETSPAGADRWVVAVQAAADGPLSVAVRKGDAEVWSQEIPVHRTEALDYAELVGVAERLARTDFAQLSSAAGRKAEPDTRPSQERGPEAIERRLQELSLTGQYLAVRGIHEQIRREGESPALLGGLVRGYANLGRLTEFQWTAAHKAFKARALLYAERLVVSQPDSPAALWHRAYARAMAGLHNGALADLPAADKCLPASGAQAPAQPAWVPLIDALCRYDTQTLKQAARQDTPVAQLAALLCYLTVEYSASGELCREAASLGLESGRRNVRLADAMCAIGGLAVEREGSEAAAAILQSEVEQLPQFVDLPAAVRERIAAWNSEEATGDDEAGGALAGLPAVITALNEAGSSEHDAGEPSWQVLGALFHETLSVDVWRRTAFLASTLCVPVEDFLEEALPLVRDHPYAAVIRAQAREFKEDRTKRVELLRAVRFGDAVPAMLPLIDLLRDQTGTIKQRGDAARRQRWNTLDEVTDDLEHRLQTGKEDRWVRFARRLQTVSPHNPTAVATLIAYDWENTASEAEAWERQFAQSPRVLAALGQRYSKLKRFDDAKRCWQARVALVPDRWAYQSWAATFRDGGDIDGWLRVLDEYLAEETDELGLNRDRVRVEIANYLMSKDDFEKALPYAEAAAGSWAEWGMRCAATCNEGLERWERAELWMSRISERYENSTEDWLLWVARTGHGDRAAASARGEEWLKNTDTKRTTNTRVLLRAALIHMLAQRYAPAAECLQRSFELKPDPFIGLLLATCADRAADASMRDAALQGVVTRSVNYRTGKSDQPRNDLIALAEVMQKALAAGSVGPQQLDELRETVRLASEGERPHMNYFVGSFADRHGAADEAVGYLCAVSQDQRQDAHAAILARDELRRRGLPPADVKPRVEVSEP